MTNNRSQSGTLGFWRRFRREDRGAAAVEIAMWVTALTVPVFSVVDIGFYVYQRMQAELAAQAALQAAWHLCDGQQPVTYLNTNAPSTSCEPNLVSTMTAAAQSTTLGTGVTIVSGYPIENWYCANTSNQLVAVATDGTVPAGPTGTVPTNCSSVVSGSTAAPDDYLRVKVSYTYASPFGGLSIVSILGSTITQTAWMKMD